MNPDIALTPDEVQKYIAQGCISFAEPMPYEKAIYVAKKRPQAMKRRMERTTPTEPVKRLTDIKRCNYPPGEEGFKQYQHDYNRAWKEAKKNPQ